MVRCGIGTKVAIRGLIPARAYAKPHHGWLKKFRPMYLAFLLSVRGELCGHHMLRSNCTLCLGGCELSRAALLSGFMPCRSVWRPATIILRLRPR